MKILRSVTRRGFNIGTAGYFSVLRPNTWFPATRLTAPRPHPGRPVDASQSAIGETQAPRIITLNGHDPRLLRRALIVLVAMTITSLLLLWIIHPY